uniref:DNA polymerase III subunit gamma/tau C-terminal domain-containing protein n=1 Tax=Francisella persica TaxID=954 RepID=UPI000AB9D89D
MLKNTFKPEQTKQTVKSVVTQNNNSTVTENTQEQSLDKKWFNLLNRLKLKGFTKTLAFNSHLISDNGETFEIQLNEDAKKILELNPQSIIKLQAIISEYLNNASFRLDIKNLLSAGQKSPTEIKRENAINKIHNDKNTKIIKQALEIDIKEQNIILTD